MRFIDLKDRLPTLPEALAPLGALAFNLWWSWDAEATALFGGLDPMGWERVRHNPVALLQDLGVDRLTSLSEDAAFVAQVRSIHARFEAYLNETNTWAQEQAPTLAPGGVGGVAYLSMEFGLHESIRIYSGGLGVLAGDHVRSASDLGLELVGVGLLYRQGYFRQLIDDGDQVTAFPKADFNRLPVRQVFNDDGTPLRIEVPHGNHSYTAQVFQLDVGRVRLLLLDADHEGNPFDHRFFTQQLYGGDGRTRVAQEVLLGVGGVRAIRAMGLRPAVFHLNEGHCAFAPVELLRERVLQGEPLGAAAEAVKRQVVFTTHTPVPAGHDRFSYYTVEEALGGYREKLGWPQGTIMDMGRVRPTDIHEPLCMTVLALKLSRSTNGVSALHGAVSREMWKDLFPLVLDTAQVPIGHVTNGVHPLFWMGPELRALFDDRLPGWRRRLSDLAYWEESFSAVSDEDLWSVHNAQKARLAQLVSTRCRGAHLDEHALTLGFARRFAPYKRANLLFTDPDRLEALLDHDMPVRLLVSGKAHPQDLHGQALLGEILRFTRDGRFRDRVIFLEEYDMILGRALTQGCDVWLNTPRRPREASGTSGQKAALNGVLNASILDGWWPEAYDGTNGWAIGEAREYATVEEQDAADAESLYQILEHQLRPLFFHRDDRGIPRGWVEKMRRSIITCLPVFNTHRMVEDYVSGIYLG